METKLGKITLPPWAQGVIAVASLAGIAYGSYLGFNFFKKKKEEKESKKVTDDIEKELKDEIKNTGLKLSKPNSAYSSAISTIVKLLDGMESSSSEMQVVEQIIKVVKTKTDWLYLVKEFGTKNIKDAFYGETNYDLITLLKDQLDTAIAFGSINVDGYNKKIFFPTDTKDILSDYLKTIGIDF